MSKEGTRLSPWQAKIQVGSQVVIVQICQYFGRDRLDVRYYFDDDGTLKPTKKGISLPVQKTAQLSKILRRAEKAVSARGGRK